MTHNNIVVKSANLPTLFLGFVATVNLTALLAVPSVTFFLWAPVALAARRNSAARRGRNIGLWRARVLQVSTRETGPGPGFKSQDERRAGAGAMGMGMGMGMGGGGGGPGGGSWMLSLLVGDYSGGAVHVESS